MCTTQPPRRARTVQAARTLCGLLGLLVARTPAPEHALRKPAVGTALVCQPSVLHPGDTLELTMEVPHGGYLAIVAPGELWFFLVHPHPSPGKSALMPAAEFRNVKRLRLAVSTTVAVPRAYGHSSPTVVFGRDGLYRILLGENLESHDLSVSWCV